jgi:hypothetical protein
LDALLQQIEVDPALSITLRMKRRALPRWVMEWGMRGVTKRANRTIHRHDPVAFLGVMGEGCRPVFNRSLPYSKHHKTIIRSIDEFLAQRWL